MHLRHDPVYPSRRSPVLAENIVATSQPLATQAGLTILQQGGNAVDAAIATAAALTVVEPSGNGLGSDAFCILWDGKELHGLNASGRAPAAWSPERFPDGMPGKGVDSITVPGAISAWVALSERFGRLGLATVLAPAIKYAEDGFLVSPVIAKLWDNAAQSLGQPAGFRANLPARWPRPARRGTVPQPRRRAHLARHRRDPWAGILRRGNRRGNRRLYSGQWRRHDPRGSGRASPRVVRHHFPELRRRPNCTKSRPTVRASPR